MSDRSLMGFGVHSNNSEMSSDRGSSKGPRRPRDRDRDRREREQAKREDKQKAILASMMQAISERPDLNSM